VLRVLGVIEWRWWPDVDVVVVSWSRCRNHGMTTSSCRDNESALKWQDYVEHDDVVVHDDNLQANDVAAYIYKVINFF